MNHQPLLPWNTLERKKKRENEEKKEKRKRRRRKKNKNKINRNNEGERRVIREQWKEKVNGGQHFNYPSISNWSSVISKTLSSSNYSVLKLKRLLGVTRWSASSGWRSELFASSTAFFCVVSRNWRPRRNCIVLVRRIRAVKTQVPCDAVYKLYNHVTLYLFWA